MLTCSYASADPSERVVAFYEERASCRGDEGGRVMCHGEAVPFGEYFVYIDAASDERDGTTSYILEVWWRGCTWELE